MHKDAAPDSRTCEEPSSRGYATEDRPCAHHHAVPVGDKTNAIEKRRRNRSVQKTKRKPNSIGNEADKGAFQVVLTSGKRMTNSAKKVIEHTCAFNTMLTWDEGEQPSSEDAHEVGTTKAVLQKVASSANKYCGKHNQYPHSATSGTEFGISVKSQSRQCSTTMKQAVGDHSRVNVPPAPARGQLPHHPRGTGSDQAGTASCSEVSEPPRSPVASDGGFKDNTHRQGFLAS